MYWGRGSELFWEQTYWVKAYHSQQGSALALGRWRNFSEHVKKTDGFKEINRKTALCCTQTSHVMIQTSQIAVRIMICHSHAIPFCFVIYSNHVLVFKQSDVVHYLVHLTLKISLTWQKHLKVGKLSSKENSWNTTKDRKRLKNPVWCILFEKGLSLCISSHTTSRSCLF